MDMELPVWSLEKVFHTGDEFFREMEADLGRARKTIELEAYIFADDPLGRRIAHSLAEQARRGISVRVMVDGVGSPAWAVRFLPELVQAGVQAKVYHPLPWIFWSYSLIWRRGVNGMLAFFRKVNRRNHRKVCIIDRERAWAGSMNISASHVEEFSGPKAWRDTGVHVVGPAVIFLCAAFEKAWRRARGADQGVHRGYFEHPGKKKRKPPLLVRLNDTRRKRKKYLEDLIERIGRAGRRVWITTPYFVPSGGLIRALRAAAARGIDLRILVPGSPDVFFMKWVSAAFYGGLIGSGVRFFEYLPRVLHAKFLMIDDWATIGSSNLNHRSLFHDLEVDLVVHSPEALGSLEAQFARDLENSMEVTPADVTKQPFFARVAGWIGLLFRYWL